MLSLAKFSIRRPRIALAGWLVVVAVLTLLGLGASRSLSPTVSVVPGTQSARAQDLANAQFGPTQLVPVLLEGPKGQLDRQGPRLVVALTKRPHTRVLSAWDAGSASAGLRAKPTAAMIVVSVDRPEKQVVKYDQPQIERLVSRTVLAPVHAYISGQPSIDQAWQHESISTLKTASVIALIGLFGIVLLGLRAPIAAVVVTGVAAATTFSALGLMAVLGKFMAIDAIALATGAIAGLARGASYSIVMLDRIHRDEEAQPARAPSSAVTVAVDTTGRAVLYAGTVMAVAMLVADLLGPTDVLATLGIGALLCTLLGTGAAVVVVPAAAVLVGPALNWRLPAPAFLSRIWDRLVGLGGSVVRYPLPLGALATIVLLLLAVPAAATKSGPMDIRQLPSHNQARVAFNEISRVMGPGYATPYDIIVSNPNGPLTTSAHLASLNRFETQIAKDTAVTGVTGPGAVFGPSATDLKKFGPTLAHSVKLSNQSKKDLLKLINGLGLAGAGSAQLQAGLQQASAGATQLHSGTGQAQSGSAQLHAGLATAKTGSAQLTAGLNTALAGAQRLHSGADLVLGGSKLLQANMGKALSGAQALKAGSATALAGANQLSAGLAAGAPQVKAGLPAVGQLSSTSSAVVGEIKTAQGASAAAAGEVNTALSTLQGMTTGKNDPKYQAALDALSRASGSASQVSAPMSQAYTSAATAALLASGVNQKINELSPQLTDAASGAAQLAAGLKKLRAGNAELASGLDQLTAGSGKLSGYIGQIATGTGQLAGASGLGHAASGSAQLDSGLAKLEVGATALEIGLGQLNGGAGQLAEGLAAGVGPAGQLVTGLGTMQAEVIKSRGKIPSTKDLEKLQRQSPGIFNSGYFVLAAVEGAQAADRNAATFSINLLRGGNAAQIIVTPRFALSDKRTEGLGTRLRTMSAGFARANRLGVAVGGPAGSLFDNAASARAKLPAALVGSALVVIVMLMLMWRSILIPLATVFSAALTTAAGFGVMQLLFGGGSPPLGGPGTFDPVTVLEVIVAMFGATLLYVVVLVTRARDYFVASGDARRSLTRAMRATVAATTGIALLTIGVIVPFAFSEMMGIRRIAVAAGIAVAITAFVIVPVVLPALMSLLGRVGWWPTHGPKPSSPRPARVRAHRWPTPHLPHRPARPAHP